MPINLESVESQIDSISGCLMLTWVELVTLPIHNSFWVWVIFDIFNIKMIIKFYKIYLKFIQKFVKVKVLMSPSHAHSKLVF